MSNSSEFVLGSQVFVIAEISGNHGGSLENAKQLIKDAQESGANAVKFQAYTPDSITLNSTKKILLIDSIGKLANAYSYGQIAFIGGGFSGNLHNILEPAVFGLPVIFGPKHKRFPEAQTFIDAGIGFSVADQESLKMAFKSIVENQENLKIKTTDLVLSSQGATQKIVDFLEEK